MISDIAIESYVSAELFRICNEVNRYHPVSMSYYRIHMNQILSGKIEIHEDKLSYLQKLKYGRA